MISEDGWFTSSVALLCVILSVLMRLEFMTEIKAEIRMLQQEVNDRFDKIDQKFHKIDQRFDKVDQRFDKIDQRFDKIDQRFDNLPEELSAFFEPKKQTK